MAPSSWVGNYHHVFSQAPFILGNIYDSRFNHLADTSRLNAAAPPPPSVGTSQREPTLILTTDSPVGGAATAADVGNDDVGLRPHPSPPPPLRRGR